MTNAPLDFSQDFPWLKKYPVHIPWDSPMEPCTLPTLLDNTCLRVPQNNCMDFLGKKYTYATVQVLSNKIAQGLQTLGVKKGDRVGLFMPNCPYFVLFYFGVLKAGGIVVNYNPLYLEHDIKEQIKDSGTRIMVTLDLTTLYDKLHSFLPTPLEKIIVCPLGDTLPFLKKLFFKVFQGKKRVNLTYSSKIVSFNTLIQNKGNYKDPLLQLDDVALFQYTGGTTGTPKAAMLTHGNVSINAHQAYVWLQSAGHDTHKVLAALPLFHVFAMTAVMNVTIKMGAEMIMMFPRFCVKEALRLIHKHKIDFFPAVPSIYNKINCDKNTPRYNLKSLRVCLSGGAPLPFDIKHQFESLTGCTLIEAYGLSETCPAVTSNPLTGPYKKDSIGIPFPQTIVTIRSLTDPSQTMPLGELGEICVQGPQVMKGYWNRPHETQQVLHQGFLHTGDVGYMDHEGYVFLVDRLKDLIISNGYNIYPRHVEDALYAHGAVEEAIVMGVPDAEKGEVPKAFVTLKKNSHVTVKDLLRFLETKLSVLQRPKTIVIRDTLPKTMIGKLSKKDLKDMEEA